MNTLKFQDKSTTKVMGSKSSKMFKSLISVVLSPTNVQRVGPRNASEAEKLVQNNTEHLFGPDKTAEFHLTKHFVSFAIYTEEEMDMVGLVSFDDHPNVPAVPACEWYYWLHNLYEIDGWTTLNTIWIHYAVYDRRYTFVFLKPILQVLFESIETLQNVAMVCPPGVGKIDFIEDVSVRIPPTGFSNFKISQTIYHCKRADFVCNYTIRRAVEEDNDDLVAIVPKLLEDYYGAYYISEMISAKDAGRQIIVAEYRGCAVGLLCLNEEVNYELLNEQFELIPYNGLRKPDSADELISLNLSNLALVLGGEDELDTLSYSKIDQAEKSLIESDIPSTENSEDDFSLLNLSSTLIFNYMYEDDNNDTQTEGSESSLESKYSTIMLNEEYQDHIYNIDKQSSYTTGYFLEKRASRASKLQDLQEIPTFHGHPNAFTLELCCAAPEHEDSLYLLLQAAYECFPERDYCVVSFPSHSTVSYIKKHFARIIPRNNSTFSHELYGLHKNAILGQPSVRVGIPEDKPPLSELISTLMKGALIEEQFSAAVDNPSSPLRAYVFLIEHQIVGCAVISEEGEQEYLDLNFSIESWINTKFTKFGMYGSIDHFILSPVFQRLQPFYLRELHRLSSVYVFFHKLRRYEYITSHKSLPIINALINMAPVKPTTRPEFDKTIISQYNLPDILNKRLAPFALYLTTPRLTSMSRIEINHRIVVIGAGDTAVSFLESIIFSKNPKCLVIFCNITVVSPHGVTYHKAPNKIREMVFVGNGRLDRRHLDSICLRTYVHVVTGVMTHIDRKDKIVVINDESYLNYDYLFLLCGEQFQKAPKSKEIVKKRPEFPQNVFIINTEADAGNAFTTLRRYLETTKQGLVVVFGHYLEACCCLAALLELGIAGPNLIYVDPSPEHNPANGRHDHLTMFFNNKDIETTVMAEILEQGITIYQDYDFVEWEYDSHNNVIAAARFESKYKFIDIELTALFMYHSRSVSVRTFQAITRCGLVFNGHLVIDKNNQTNDPYIYGAGPLTMYSAKYHAEHLMHKYFNGEEVGSKLGQQIRKMLVPETFWDYTELEPTKHMPIVHHCRFPGNMHYLHIHKPGKPVPLEVAVNKGPYGSVLVTGDLRKLESRGYFRLHLNQYNTVETITCLAKFELNVQNLILLYGKHESLLNNLSLRFEMQQISDLFAFFKEPWACAIFHPKFYLLLEEFKAMINCLETSDGKILIEEIRNAFEANNWNPLQKMQWDEIEEICRDTDYFQRVEKKLLVFLHENYMYLPVYANQIVIRWIFHQIQSSPLFVPTSLLSTDKRHQAQKFLSTMRY